MPWERLIHEICIWWEPSCACDLSMSCIYLFIHRNMCMQDYASSRSNLWRTWTSIPGLTFTFCPVINVWSCIQSAAIPWLKTDDSSIAQQLGNSLGTWEAWVQVPVLTIQSMDLIWISSQPRWLHLHHIAGYSTPLSPLFCVLMTRSWHNFPGDVLVQEDTFLILTINKSVCWWKRKEVFEIVLFSTKMRIFPLLWPSIAQAPKWLLRHKKLFLSIRIISLGLQRICT